MESPLNLAPAAPAVDVGVRPPRQRSRPVARPATLPSRVPRRTGALRAWMVTLPVDLAAMLAPLLLTVHYWKGTIFTAALTTAIFAAGGLYRERRHVSL